MSLRRKLAIATWSEPREGNIYGKMTVDMTEAQRYIEHVRETTGEKVTITHLVGRAAAEGLAHAPTLNGRIVFDRFIPFETVDVAFLVALEGGSDLGKVKVERVNEKSVAELAVELGAHGRKLRDGKDEAFEKSKGALKLMPRWLLRRFLWLVGFLSSGLGLNLKGLGLEPFPFGSCIVTSVGMLGLDEGFAPPTPFARVPIYLLVGAIRPQPAVVDGQVVVRDQVTITATVDHRFVDGYQLGTLAKIFKDVLLNPWQLDAKALPAPGAAIAAPQEVSA
ncbi:MAG: 2-oxo acid dehydrogenase subunit E2 [Bradymonadaceae bacterium]|nr:2-oxo acid dehydrogenase subunit E2 [Lujinxingiaceae bacterium]